MVLLCAVSPGAAVVHGGAVGLRKRCPLGLCPFGVSPLSKQSPGLWPSPAHVPPMWDQQRPAGPRRSIISVSSGSPGND